MKTHTRTKTDNTGWYILTIIFLGSLAAYIYDAEATTRFYTAVWDIVVAWWWLPVAIIGGVIGAIILVAWLFGG